VNRPHFFEFLAARLFKGCCVNEFLLEELFGFVEPDVTGDDIDGFLPATMLASLQAAAVHPVLRLHCGPPLESSKPATTIATLSYSSLE